MSAKYDPRAKNDFHTLNRSGVYHECDRQTDGRTDRLYDSTGAALHYAARPINQNWKVINADVRHSLNSS